jgi:hypothetical protein
VSKRRHIFAGRKPVRAEAIAGFVIFVVAGPAVDIQRECFAPPGV